MHTLKHALLPVLLCVALAGCTANSGEPTEQQADTLASAEAGEVFVDTVSIEGNAEPIELKRYQTPEGFPTPFSTAYPANMVLEETSTPGIGDFVRIVSDPDAAPDSQVLVEFQAYPDTSEFEIVYEANRRRAEGYGELSQRRPHIVGAVTEFTFVSDDDSGYIVFGERANRYYSILVRFPASYSEGYEPRIESIFKHWQWLNGGG